MKTKGGFLNMKQQNLAKHGLWVLVLGFALTGCFGKKEEEVPPAGEAPAATEVPAETSAPAGEAPAETPAH